MEYFVVKGCYVNYLARTVAFKMLCEVVEMLTWIWDRARQLPPPVSRRRMVSKVEKMEKKISDGGMAAIDVESQFFIGDRVRIMADFEFAFRKDCK